MDNPTIVFPEPRKVAVEDRPVDEPGDGQMLIEAERSLISIGTELTILSGEFAPDSTWAGMGRFPFLPGYNHVGKVVAVGDGLDDTWVGRRVGSYSRHAKYVLETAAKVRPIDRQIDPEQAAFFAMAEIAMNGVRRGRVTWGEAVAVFGLGLVGQLTVDFCWLAGARPVIGIDVADARLDRLRQATGIHTINPEREDLEECVSGFTRDRMADVVFEVTGEPDSIPGEFDILKPQGRFVVLSSPRGPSTFDFHDMCNSPSYTIIGAHNMSHPSQPSPENPWTQRRHCELFFDLLAAGQIDLRRLISHRVPYADAPAIYGQLLVDRSQIMGAVLNWDS